MSARRGLPPRGQPLDHHRPSSQTLVDGPQLFGLIQQAKASMSRTGTLAA